MRRTLVVVLATLTLAGAASAQTVWGGRNASGGYTAQAAPRFTRGPVDPNAPPPQMQRLCAYRPDGQPMTSLFVRGGPGTVVTCQASMNQPVGSSCVCNGHAGTVFETPVW